MTARFEGADLYVMIDYAARECGAPEGWVEAVAVDLQDSGEWDRMIDIFNDAADRANKRLDPEGGAHGAVGTAG